MNISSLKDLLTFSITNGLPVLIAGPPGIGKSDVVDQATTAADADFIVSHPVVSDPTDYKGMPWVQNGQAEFLPFGELNRLIKATKRTVFFLDDLGQASPTVQAAAMQLILARQINGHKISDLVTFIAATNRRQDKAGVSGILEPVKSRFATIVELEVDTEDWCKWALTVGNMPVELISFIRFRPTLLSKFEATKEIKNTPSPRTVAYIGKMQNAGIPAHLELDAYTGAAGNAFATEYTAFLRLFRNLPDIDQVILNPKGAAVPEEPGVLYAISGALAHRMTEATVAPITQYLERLPAEIAVCTMKDAVTRKVDLTKTKAFITWASKTGNQLF